jgi:hypothetical protein
LRSGPGLLGPSNPPLPILNPSYNTPLFLPHKQDLLTTAGHLPPHLPPLSHHDPAPGPAAAPSAAAAAPSAPTRVRSGCAADQGRRGNMEDASLAVDDVPALAAAMTNFGGSSGGAPGACPASAAAVGRGGPRPSYASVLAASRSSAADGRNDDVVGSSGRPRDQVKLNGAAAAGSGLPPKISSGGSRGRAGAAAGGPPAWLADGMALPAPAGFYAVFDGHCGASAAQFAAERAFRHVIGSPCFPDRPEAALVSAGRCVGRLFQARLLPVLSLDITRHAITPALLALTRKQAHNQPKRTNKPSDQPMRCAN